jgi:eukaryotic-like serine/threonine-protein kinase
MILLLLLLFQQPTAQDMPQELVWVSRAGKVLGRVGAVQNAIFFPELSPDGKSIAVSARDGEVNDRDVWIHDVAAGSKRVHSPAKGNDNFPIWSPDGKQIVWTSSRTGEYELYRQDSLLLKQPASQYPRSISPNGKWLLYTQSDKKRDLFLLNLDGEPKPKPVFPGAPYWTDAGRFSPDGRYFAFVSNEAGPFEVYVASVEDPAKRWKVSRELSNGWGGGGSGPRWRADGKELFYTMGDAMLAVEVSTEGEFKSGAVKRLFAAPGMMGSFPDEAPWLAKYDVAADGQKFVFVRRVP